MDVNTEFYRSCAITLPGQENGFVASPKVHSDSIRSTPLVGASAGNSPLQTIVRRIRRIVRYQAARVALLILPVLITACGGGDTIDVVPSAVSPIPSPEPVQMSQNSPEVVFDGNSIALTDGDSLSTLSVVLENNGAESALRAGSIDSNTLQSEFEITGDCRYSDSNVSASNGSWRFELAQACVMNQITDFRLEEGTAVSLVFDALLDTSLNSIQFNSTQR